MIFPGFDNFQQRDDFFKEVSRLLRDTLPLELQKFSDITSSGNNWMRLEYPIIFPGSAYELQFATKSKTHTSHFGPGDKIILAYYFSQKELLGKWKNNIQLNMAIIQAKFGKEVKVAYWGKNNEKNYVMVGSRLDEKELGIKPQLYSKIISQFIMATYTPIWLAYKAVGL